MMGASTVGTRAMGWRSAGSAAEAIAHMREFVLPRLRMAVEDEDVRSARVLRRIWRHRIAFDAVPDAVMTATEADIAECCDEADGGGWGASAAILDRLEARWW